MGRWLAALKNHENAETGHPQNLRNLSGEGFDGFEGIPFGANANFCDPKPALLGKVSRVLRVPILHDSENSSAAVEAAARAVVPDAGQHVEAHPVETNSIESVAAPEAETAICDEALYARALRLHGPQSYGMAMRVLGWGGTRAGRAEAALREAGHITFNKLGRAVLIDAGGRGGQGATQLARLRTAAVCRREALRPATTNVGGTQ